MQYSVVSVLALALAASVSAGYSNDSTPVVYITEVVNAYITYCPEPTVFTYGGKVYNVTEPGYVNITNCPCTIIKPVITKPVVICHTCAPVPTSAPAYGNSTAPSATSPVGTTSQPALPANPSEIAANSGNTALAFSGGSLAGLLGLAAYIL